MSHTPIRKLGDPGILMKLRNSSRIRWPPNSYIKFLLEFFKNSSLFFHALGLWDSENCPCIPFQQCTSLQRLFNLVRKGIFSKTSPVRVKAIETIKKSICNKKDRLVKCCNQVTTTTTTTTTPAPAIQLSHMPPSNTRGSYFESLVKLLRKVSHPWRSGYSASLLVWRFAVQAPAPATLEKVVNQDKSSWTHTTVSERITLA